MSRIPPISTQARRLRALALAIVLALAALIAAYNVFIQPAGIVPLAPADLATVEDTGPHRIFTYATLTNPLVRFVVTGRAGDQSPAALPGYRRDGRDIVPDPESRVAGYVIEVSTAELRRLDRYERVGQRYDRVEVMLDDGETAWVYRMLPR